MDGNLTSKGEMTVCPGRRMADCLYYHLWSGSQKEEKDQGDLAVETRLDAGKNTSHSGM